MNVIGLNFSFLPPGIPGGMATYSWSLLDALVALNRYRFVLYAQAGHVVPEHLADHVRLVTVPLFGGRLKRVMWEQTALPVLALKDRVDLMFSSGNAGPVLGWFAKVVTIHDLIYAMVPDRVDRHQARYRRVMDVMTARTADAVISVSEATANDIRFCKLPVGGRLHVVPEAAGPGFSAATPDDDPIDRAMITVAEPFVMMVASVLPHKSPRMVVDAAATLWHGAGIRTVILGTDPRGALAQTLMAAGNTGIVCLYGVPTPVLAAYYRRALCLVMPSEYEGFGLPILEAQISGCPVITTRRGALPEVAGDAAIFVEPGNAAAMADAVLGLYHDTAARAALVARGFPNAARFSWEQAAERTAAIFDDCLARRPRGLARRPADPRGL